MMPSGLRPIPTPRCSPSSRAPTRRRPEPGGGTASHSSARRGFPAFPAPSMYQHHLLDRIAVMVAYDFAGKVVLITGGTSGIGRATVIAFGAAGAHVAVSGRRQAEGEETVRLVEQAGGSAVIRTLRTLRHCRRLALAP